MLQEILKKSIRHPAVDFARDMTRRCHDKLRLVARLNDAIQPVGLPVHGIPFSELRNDAAHGGDGAAKLDRMTVDAMKRRLVLESPMILATNRTSSSYTLAPLEVPCAASVAFLPFFPHYHP